MAILGNVCFIQILSVSLNIKCELIAFLGHSKPAAIQTTNQKANSAGSLQLFPGPSAYMAFVTIWTMCWRIPIPMLEIECNSNMKFNKKFSHFVLC